MIFAFLDLELDDRHRELRRSGEALRVEPRVFDLLVHLIRNRDRVISRGELLEVVWDGVAVSESSVSTAMSTLRRVLGGTGGADGPIRTVHGRGYRFVAPVAEQASAPAEATLPRASAQSAASREPILVGRESVLSALDDALDEVRAARGRTVLLVGEPGIGKSRLLESLAPRAQAAGARVVASRCLEGDSTPAFWPWVRVLRALYEPLGDAPFERHAYALAPLLPELLTPAERADRQPEAERFRVFDAVAQIHVAAAEAAPLAVLVDDLQWGDAASLEVFAYLARELKQTPVLLVAALREPQVDPSPPLRRALAELSRESHVERVELRGFSLVEVARYLELALGRPPSDELVQRLCDRTDGNPFFLREVVHWLNRDGWLDREVRAAELEVPPRVQEVIERRLEALSPDSLQWLRFASAIGREFDLRLLAEAARVPRDALLEALDEAARTHIVEETGERPGRYRFTHALVRDTAYWGLAPGERARLHEELALALQRRFGDEAGPHLAELASHFEAALARGHESRAIECAARAARHAAERTAYFEAAQLFERALRIADQHCPDSDTALELLLGLGEANLAAGDTRATQAAFGRAAALARDLGQPKAFVHAAIGYGATAIWGRRPDPGEEALLEEALTLVGASAPAPRAQLLSRLAALRGYTTSFTFQRKAALEALRLAEAADDLEARVEALRARHLVLQGPDELAERERLAQEVLAVGRELGREHRTFAVREFQACERLTRGDRSGFEAALEDAERVARDSHHPAFLWLSGVVRASSLLLAGEFAEAEQRIQEAAAHGRRARSPQAAPAALAQIFALRRAQGRLPELRAAFEDVVAQLDWIGGYPATLRAVLYTELGDLDAARAIFDTLLRGDFLQRHSGVDWLICTAELAGVCAALGDSAAARELERHLAPYADLHAVYSGPLLYAGPVPLFLGRLALVRNAHIDARALFERARTMARSVGARVAEEQADAELAALFA